MAQTEEEQPAHLHSLSHEKCIILSPVASQCWESQEEGKERFCAVNRAVMSDRGIELRRISGQTSENQLLPHQTKLFLSVIFCKPCH